MAGSSPSDSSLQFFQRGTAPQWAFLLSEYKEILRLHAHKSRGFRKNGPEELIKLDNWFHETLPACIHARKDKHVTHEELVQITKWKLTRGKNRRQLLDLVRINTELAVKQTTQKAFRKIPNLSAAISALTNLKGIGPQTASAVLCAGFPDHCPYMADECMLSTPGVEATDYTLNEFTNYATQIKTCTDKLIEADPTTKWTPHKVEMALWVHYLAKELKPSVLENMPYGDGSARTAASKTQLEEEISNTSDGDIGVTDSRNGNGNSNGRHGSALDEDSNISVPASTGSISGEDSKLSNGDDDSRHSGEFRAPYAAANNSNNSSNSNHHHHHLSNSNESSAESLSLASESSSVADETSQGSASAAGHNGDSSSQHHNHAVDPVPIHLSSLSQGTEDANHVLSSSNSCASELPIAPASLEEPALKKIRASE